MLNRLAKLASRSAQLRLAVIEKRAASLLGAAGKWAMNHKLPVGLGAVAGVTGAQGAVGKYRETKAGFDPAVQQVMLGKPPTPPGA